MTSTFDSASLLEQSFWLSFGMNREFLREAGIDAWMNEAVATVFMTGCEKSFSKGQVDALRALLVLKKTGDGAWRRNIDDLLSSYGLEVLLSDAKYSDQTSENEQ